GASHIALSAAPVNGRIAIQDFPPMPSLGHTNAIIVSRYGSQITRYQQRTVCLFAFAKEADHALLGVVTIHPFKALGLEVELVQGWFSPIQRVEVTNPPLQPLMEWRGQQMPVQAGVMVPLLPLTEFSAHEQQLLAGPSVHVAQEQP